MEICRVPENPTDTICTSLGERNFSSKTGDAINLINLNRFGHSGSMYSLLPGRVGLEDEVVRKGPVWLGGAKPPGSHPSDPHWDIVWGGCRQRAVDTVGWFEGSVIIIFMTFQVCMFISFNNMKSVKNTYSLIISYISKITCPKKHIWHIKIKYHISSSEFLYEPPWFYQVPPYSRSFRDRPMFIRSSPGTNIWVWILEL